ncbi:glycoside hydrolase superfamily, partial [Chytridium lagenaria]
NTFGWKGRAVYQVLTDRFSPEGVANRCGDLRGYCGGTFNGLTKNLEYVKEMGFDAIWISPVIANDPEGYHGYYAYDLYTINPKFGTADDLKRLIAAARAKDIYVMVDIVANHLGAHNITTLSDFPAPFSSPDKFHKFCNIDYNNQTSVEQCWLDRKLPDLDTENPEVVKSLNDWIAWLSREFGFDGLRIDTAKHVRLEFWPDFIKSSGNLFSMGEVLSDNVPFTASYQPSMQSLLNYPAYYKIYRGLFESGNRGKSMWEIESQLANDRAAYQDTSVLGTFIDNHDQPRFADLNSDPVALKNALALALFTDGIPVIYYGTELAIKSPGTSGPIDPRNRQPLWDQLRTVWYAGNQAMMNARSVRGFLGTLLRIRRANVVGALGAFFVGSRHTR